MLRNDPYVRQESRRAVQNNNNQLRNLMQQESNKLVAKASKLSQLTKSDEPFEISDVHNMIGRLDEHYSLRRSLARELGLDGLSNQIKGLSCKLKEIAEKHENDTNTA
tara:strand:- start:240 stop:563 length:324 start_codon:yes stop_codon:yes gene_type:complete